MCTEHPKSLLYSENDRSPYIGIGMSCWVGEDNLLHSFHGCKGYELLQHLLLHVNQRSCACLSVTSNGYGSVQFKSPEKPS